MGTRCAHPSVSAQTAQATKISGTHWKERGMYDNLKDKYGDHALQDSTR